MQEIVNHRAIITPDQIVRFHSIKPSQDIPGWSKSTRLSSVSFPLYHEKTGTHEFFQFKDGRFGCQFHDEYLALPQQSIFPSEQAYWDYVLSRVHQDPEDRPGRFYPSDVRRLGLTRKNGEYHVRCEHCGKEHRFYDRNKTFVHVVTGEKHHEHFHALCCDCLENAEFWTCTCDNCGKQEIRESNVFIGAWQPHITIIPEKENMNQWIEMAPLCPDCDNKLAPLYQEDDGSFCVTSALYTKATGKVIDWDKDKRVRVPA